MGRSLLVSPSRPTLHVSNGAAVRDAVAARADANHRHRRADEAIAEPHAVGVATDAPTGNAAERYVHFEAPDGHLYQVVQRL